MDCSNIFDCDEIRHVLDPYDQGIETLLRYADIERVLLPRRNEFSG